MSKRLSCIILVLLLGFHFLSNAQERFTVHVVNGGSLTVTNNIIICNEDTSINIATTQNLTTNAYNVFADFVFDFRLALQSPARNVGVNSANPLFGDITGMPRVMNGSIDLGAFESPDTEHSGVGIVHKTPGGALTLYNNIIINNFENIPNVCESVTGDHNLTTNTDGVFADDLQDFSLAESSTAIDAGDNQQASQTTDLKGKPRIMDETVDLGAFEHPDEAHGTLYVVHQTNGGTLNLYNNIIFNNEPDEQHVNVPNAESHNLLSASSAVFKNEFKNFSLAESSPAINAGDNSHISLPRDLLNRTRIMGGTVDLGAFETRDAEHSTIYAIHQTGNGTLQLHNNISILNLDSILNVDSHVAGGHNLTEDMTSVFVNDTNNFRLLSTSPAVDAGDNQYMPLPTDISDSNRIPCEGTVDLGAFETQPESHAITLTATTVTNDNCSGNVTILVASGGQTYQWSHSNVTSDTVIVSPLVPTCYTVTAFWNSSCPWSDSATVCVDPSDVVENSHGSPSTSGQQFWVSFMSNYYETPKLSLLISSQTDCSGNIVNPNTGWSTTFSVSANQTTQVAIPNAQAYCNDPGVVGNYGLLVTATDNISLYASNFENFSYDVTNILPVPALSNEYITQSYTPLMNTEFLIVATVDGTTVEIIPSQNTSDAHLAFTPYTVTLNQGQTYLVMSDHGGVTGDLSGSRVRSTDPLKPIALFNGNVCANIPVGNKWCDHVVEQAFGTHFWGQQFVVTNTIGMPYDRVKITASANNTVVTRDGNYLTTLQANNSYEFQLNANDTVCYLETSHPCATYLYIPGGQPNFTENYRGDPSMVWISPVEQRIQEITFSTFNSPNINHHNVNVVIPTKENATVTFDGASILSLFHPVPSNPMFSYARLDIPNGTHTLSGSHGVVAHVYGTGHCESYAYSVGSKAALLSQQLYVNQTLSTELEDNEFCTYEEITFDASVNYPCDSVVWSFGDSYNTYQGMHLTHRYTTEGSFPVAMTVFMTDDYGLHCTSVYAQLIIHDGYHVFYTDTVCQGEHYTLHGFNYIADTTGPVTVTRDVDIPDSECDSTYVLELMVLQRIFPYYDTICAGNDYHGHGFDLISPAQGAHLMTHTSQRQPCDSITELHLLVTPNINDIYGIHGLENICVGETYDYFIDTLSGLTDIVWTVPQGAFIQSGQGTERATVYFTENASDGFITLTGTNACGNASFSLPIHPKPVYYIQISDTVCGIGQPYHRYGFDIDSVQEEHSVFFHQYLSETCCDSTIVLTLSVVDVPSINILANTISHCEGETVGLTACCLHDNLFWHDTLNGIAPHYEWSTGDTVPSIVVTLDTTVAYHLSVSNAYGCTTEADTILLVTPAVTVSDTLTLCDGDLPYAYHDTLFADGSVSGQYIWHQQSADGCDSTVTLFLTIGHSADTTINVTVFNSSLPYVLNDSSYTQEGTYTQHLQTAAGCDSTLTLNLTVIPYSLPDNVDSADCTVFSTGNDWGIAVDWSSSEMVSPLVIPLVGDVDGDEIPEIICFAPNQTYNFYGVTEVKVYNTITHQVIHTIDLPHKVCTFDASPYGIIKLPNGHVIFVVTMMNNSMQAYDLTAFDTDPLWTSSTPYDAPNIGFADFNSDTYPEIYVGNRIYDAETGSLLAHGPAGSNEGLSYGHAGEHKLPSPCVANVAGDFKPDLILGNEVYDITITNRNGTEGNSMSLLASVSPPQGAPADGHPQVADFNSDGHLDVLISNKNSLYGNVYCYVWDIHNGNVSNMLQIPNNNHGKSIPLIADVDNDGAMEIVIQSGASYGNKVKCYKYDTTASEFTFQWDIYVDEDSYSNSMSVFDLNNDGTNDLLISDQTSVRIVNGSGRSHLTGNDTISVYALSSLVFGECTVMQYPIIADVDADGSAELVFCGQFGAGHTYQGYLNVFKSAGVPWAPARKVWNQYMYNVTNVNEDLTIPQHLFNNATAFTDPEGVVRRPFNNFLQQATTIDQYGRPFYAVPDVAVGPSASSQMVGDSLVLTFSYCNNGDNTLNAPYPITVFANAYGGDTVCTVTINGNLPVDSCTQGEIRLPVSVLCGFPNLDSLVVAVNGNNVGIAQNGSLQPECDTTNNTVSVPVTMHADTVHLSATACDSYIWYGDTLSQSGEYTHTLTNAAGCDSVEVLQLTIIPLPTLSHTPDTVIIAGTSATLWAAGTDIMYWTDGNDSILSSGDSLVVSPETSTTYYLGGQNYAAAGDNLVVNGDFEAGNTGFGSDYTYVTPQSQYHNYGRYYIIQDGHLVWGPSDLHGHGGSGLFMLVDGATTPNSVIWQQTVDVIPNTYYAFSAQIASTGYSNMYGSYAWLQFSINGTQLGPIFHSPSVADSWQPYYEVWYSGDNTSATLTLLNQNNTADGNDFGLDDISFFPLTGCSITDSIQVYVTEFPDNVDSADCTFLPEGTEWGIGQPLISSASAIAVSTPMVGDIDDDGQQEIVFPAGNSSVVSTINIFNADATLKSQINTVGFYIWNSVGLAKVKWQENESKSIIVVLGTNKRLYAYDAQGTQLWQSNEIFGCQSNESGPLPAISFADFNHDGWTEIYLGGDIYDAATGVLLSRASGNKGYSGRTWNTQKNTYHTIAADFYGDSNLELAAGNTVYAVDIQSRTDFNANQMSVVKEVPSSAMKMEDNSSIPFTDGNTYLADMNLDGRLDVLVMNVDQSNRVVYLYVWDVENQSVICSKKITNARKFGTPQIGDINQDGYDEICFITGTYSDHGTGNNDLIYALQYNSQNSNGELEVLWTKSHSDNSACTGLTLFDFNQDGIAELIYRDRFNLRIINGSLTNHQTGATLTQPYDMAVYPCCSATGLEYPLVVDVDLDGEAEIVVGGSTVESDYGHLYIFKSAGIPWAPARKVWNQYMYNVTNVNEDLTIPQYLFNNATVFTDPEGVVRRPFNNFLQQATTIDQYGRPFYAVPDVAVGSSASSQMVGDSLVLTFSYCNNGDNTLNAPYPITVFANTYGGDTVCTVIVDENLPVDSCTQGEIRLPVSVLCGFPNLDSLVVAVNGNAGGIAQNGSLQPECDTTNNTVSVPVTMHADTVHLSATACDSYLWYGDTITLSGEYTHTISNATGCDSVEVLQLTVIPAPVRWDTLHILQSWLPYSFAAADTILPVGISDSSSFVWWAPAMDGCDTMVMQTVLVYPEMSITASGTVNTDCEGRNCFYNGPTIMINEVMLTPSSYDGSIVGGSVNGDNKQGEWIELYNPHKCDSVDISCYFLGNNAKDGGNYSGGFTLPQGTIVPPQGFCLVRGVNAPAVPANLLVQNGGNVVEVVVNDRYCIGAGGSRLWFPNAGGWFAFYDADGVPQDAISWNSTTSSCMSCNPCVPSVTDCGFSGTLASYDDISSDRKNYISSLNPLSYSGLSFRRIPDGGEWQSTPAAPTYGLCNAECVPPAESTGNAIAVANVTGGVPPYSYQWDDFAAQTTDTAFSLSAGTYMVTVTDALGNVDTAVVVVTNFVPEVSQPDGFFCLSDTMSVLQGFPAGGTYSGAVTYGDTLFFEAGVSQYLMTYTIADSNGCTATDTFQVTVAQHLFDTAATVCSNDLPLLWHGLSLEEAGSYTASVPNPNGCDSIVTLQLTVNYPQHQSDTIIAVDSYVWNGTSYSQTGVYTSSHSDENGCLQVDTLHLTIYHSVLTQLDTSICDDEFPFIWNGVTFTTAGTHIDSLTTSMGADSVVIMTVNSIPLPELTHSSDTTVQLGESLTLWAAGSDILTWTDADGNILGNGGSLTVSPQTSAYYYITGNNNTMIANNTVVTNGDFEQGNTSFTSAYTYGSNLFPEGNYCVGANAHNYHSNFVGEHDHTTGAGQFMIVNGAGTPNTNIWQQAVPVQPHTNYAFSVWVCTVSPASTSYTTLAKLQFSINGVQIGNVFQSPSSLNTWAQFYEIWNSGENTQANITILNQNTMLNGNDFGIDDVIFAPITACSSTDSIWVQVVHSDTIPLSASACDQYVWYGDTLTQSGEYQHIMTNLSGGDSVEVLTLTVTPSPVVSISGANVLCQSSTTTLSVDSAASYLWSTGATTQTIQVDTAGTYSVTVTDSYGCSGTASSHIVALDNPILSINIPEMCAGGSYTISVGYDNDDNIHLGQGETTLSMSETIFLPDGIYCEPHGCSYRSPLTFTAYADGATIQSVEDIYYVRLNIEHSWIGDLYFNITCPNGQKADLMKYGGTGDSPCNSQILPSSRGWQSGSNMAVGTYLGVAHDFGVETCDATVFGNEPGIGWNYCWSENTTQGYSYAPGQGSLIYRSANQHNGIADSSNVAAGTHFYHPDDSFTNLIGCPLNGDWYIEVQDGWSLDNGYVFGWELALSTEALPDAVFEYEHATGEGPWLSNINGSLFSLDPPADLAHDTVIAYTFSVADSNGCSFDTTVYITFYAPSHTEMDTTVCDSFTWNGTVYTTSGEYVQHLTNIHGCDSVVTCTITITPATTGYDTLVLVQNQLPYHFAPTNTTFTMQTPLESHFSYHLNNQLGCDSTVMQSVYIYHNASNQVDTTVCASALPLTWHGHTYTAAGTFSNTYLTCHGADSIVTYHLYVDNLSATLGNVTHITCYGAATGAATATVTGGQTPLTYQWTGAAGALVSSTTSISNRPAGTYTFTVTDQLGCSATVSATLNTLNGELLPGTIADNQDICTDEVLNPFTGTAASGGDNGGYQWQISTDGTNWNNAPGTGNTQNYTYPTPATNSFTLRRAWVSQNCGTVYSNTVTVTVWPSYSETITANICHGESYQANGFDVTPDLTPAPGEYTFDQILTTGHCDSSVTLLLTVSPVSEVEIVDEVCEGENYTSYGFNIAWQETMGVNQLFRDLTLQNANGCDSIIHLTLNVTDTSLRVVSLTNDFCESMTAVLSVVTDMTDYVWSTGEQTPNIIVHESGLYTVTAMQGDCQNSAHILVETCQNELFLPNAITPSNGDGLNDYFSIPEINRQDIGTFEISIFNRWGEMVFYSTDKNFQWNGEYRGEIQYQTIYNYVIHYTDNIGRPHHLVGSITVL